MPAQGTVYALSLDERDYRYVGQTRGAARTRLCGHRQTAREGKAAELRRPVVRWMREVDPRLVRVSVLERCAFEDLNDREAYWIAYLRAAGHGLLNVTPGGAGNSGWHHRPETVELLRQQSTGRRWTVEQRAAISAARIGKAHTRRHQFADPVAQVDSGMLGAHRRWHVNRNRTSPTCGLCAA